jgi:uncharacterized protein (UPF0332 family)
MTSDVERGLARAKEELAAAAALLAAGFPRQSISRAYYGAFYAAEAALTAVGVRRSKHSGVISAVGQLLVKERDLPEHVGRLLRSLFERRAAADYELLDVSDAEAAAAITDADAAVTAVAEWLRTHRTD